MKTAALIVAILVSTFSLPVAVAEEQACRFVRRAGASLLQDCGDHLRSFALRLADLRRQETSDFHGRFGFDCPFEPMCRDEPSIGGAFIAPGRWKKSAQDADAIYEALGSVPISAASWSRRGGPPPPPPAATCSVFDVSLDDVAGRAICYEYRTTETKFGATIVIVAADDATALVLAFNQPGQSAEILRDRVIALLPRFKIERGMGDKALLRWIDPSISSRGIEEKPEHHP